MKLSIIPVARGSDADHRLRPDKFQVCGHGKVQKPGRDSGNHARGSDACRTRAGCARRARRPAGPELPAHCRIDGMMDDGQERTARPTASASPSRFPTTGPDSILQQGGGGLNGTVAEPTGAQAAGDQPALVRGFAVATTDTGHQSSGGGFDGTFMQDQQAALDFEYVANGRVAVLAKQIIESYYGKPAAHSYFVGCSTGGREAMLMSQRYPLYFDGIVAGAPAMRTGHSNLATRTCHGEP